MPERFAGFLNLLRRSKVVSTTFCITQFHNFLSVCINPLKHDFGQMGIAYSKLTSFIGLWLEEVCDTKFCLKTITSATLASRAMDAWSKRHDIVALKTKRKQLKVYNGDWRCLARKFSLGVEVSVVWFFVVRSRYISLAVKKLNCFALETWEGLEPIKMFVV